MLACHGMTYKSIGELFDINRYTVGAICEFINKKPFFDLSLSF